MRNNKDSSDPGTVSAADRLAAAQPLQNPRFDWLSAGQFALSLLAVFSLICIALISIITVLWRSPSPNQEMIDSQAVSSLLFASGLGFAGMLLIPSAFYSGKRLFGQGLPALVRWDTITWLAYLFPIPILLGYFVVTGPDRSQLLLPIFHVWANGAGIVWVLNLGRWKLPSESAQRGWGAFSTGLTLTPLITFIIEIIMLVLIALTWLVLIQSRPDLEQDILYLVTLVSESAANPEVPAKWVGEFVSRPEVTGTIFLYFSLLVPLVEELLKPLAVYLLLGRKLQPWEGFMIGATAGAGFALFENLTIGAGVDAWTFVMVSRLGTAAVHVLTTGLMGWGLASAWTEQKYTRLAGSFLAAVALHGVWNGLNILTGLADFSPYLDRVNPFMSSLTRSAPAGLVVLALGSMVGLVRTNIILRRAIIAQD